MSLPYFTHLLSSFKVRLKSSMICLLTKPSPSIGVAPWLICAVDLIFQILLMWRHLTAWRWFVIEVIILYFEIICMLTGGIRLIFHVILSHQASSAYWRGNKDRESLQRVYGISFPDKKLLKVIVDFGCSCTCFLFYKMLAYFYATMSFYLHGMV